ncbi:LysR family transcriptional regulator, partial [Phascolarctobacterium succinatutens]
MDFAFYRNFITVAETGNLSAAAKRLGIVQPALSAQMKAIERNYGVQLFKMQRGKRHIELTEAGETFLQQARQLCNTEDDISLRMQAFGRRAAGTLRFSVSHVRTDYFLRSYLIPFAK